MYSLYSPRVVAPMMRTSPRDKTDLKMLAASAGAPMAEPGAHHRVRLVDEQHQVGPLLHLADDVVETVLEHAAQHGAGDDAVHLQVDDLAVAQPRGNRVRFELDAPRQPFDDGRLADAGLTDQHHGVRPFAVRENLEHLLNLGVASEDGRNAILPREQVEVGREVAQERRQLEALAELFLAELVIAHARGDARHQRVGLDAVLADDGHRHRRRRTTALLEERHEQIRRLDHLAAGTAGVMERELHHVLRRGGHTRLADVTRREGRAGDPRAPGRSRAGSD
jgi:hypothetical protein